MTTASRTLASREVPSTKLRISTRSPVAVCVLPKVMRPARFAALRAPAFCLGNIPPAMASPTGSARKWGRSLRVNVIPSCSCPITCATCRPKSPCRPRSSRRVTRLFSRESGTLAVRVHGRRIEASTATRAAGMPAGPLVARAATTRLGPIRACPAAPMVSRLPSASPTRRSVLSSKIHGVRSSPTFLFMLSMVRSRPPGRVGGNFAPKRRPSLRPRSVSLSIEPSLCGRCRIIRSTLG